MLAKVAPFAAATGAPSTSLATPPPKVIAPVEAAPAASSVSDPPSRVRPPAKVLVWVRARAPTTLISTAPAPLIAAPSVEDAVRSNFTRSGSVMAPPKPLTSPWKTTVPASIVVVPLQAAACVTTKVSLAVWLISTAPEPDTVAESVWVAPWLPTARPRVSRGVPFASATAMAVVAELSCRKPLPLICAMMSWMRAALMALTRSESCPVPPTTTLTPFNAIASLGCSNGPGRIVLVTEIELSPMTGAAPSFSRNWPL